MSIVSLADWKTYLNSHPDAHLLQTGEWGELKSEHGWSAARLIVEDCGCQILFRKLPLGLTLGYIPKPMLKNQPSDVMDRLWAGIDQICRQRRAIFCKLETDEWEDTVEPTIPIPKGFRRSPHNIQPPRTILIDLRDSDQNLLARMKQKTRYNIRLAEKKGVQVRPWNDLQAFHQMLQTTGRRDRFGTHSLDYFRRVYDLFHPSGMCELLVAESDGTALAALMVFARGKRAWYLYGASTDEQRNLMPTYVLQWEAMRWARNKGCEIYDLWGVPDLDEPELEARFESRSDGLWGVYRFKRGFGGSLKRARQAYDRVYQPLLYWSYLLWMAKGEAA